MGRKMGPPSILTREEEDRICNWINYMCKAGFPVTWEQLTVSVEKYLKEIKRPCSFFKDRRPGKTFVKSFKKRNPTIANRISQNLTSTRAAVTEEILNEWFNRVMSELTENNNEEILKDSSLECFFSAEGAQSSGPKR